MSITDSATGGVEEPDSVISSDSQETSQGVVAEQAEAVHASEDAPAAEADKAAEQDTRDADTSEATDPTEGFENLHIRIMLPIKYRTKNTIFMHVKSCCFHITFFFNIKISSGTCFDCDSSRQFLSACV